MINDLVVDYEDVHLGYPRPHYKGTMKYHDRQIWATLFHIETSPFYATKVTEVYQRMFNMSIRSCTVGLVLKKFVNWGYLKRVKKRKVYTYVFLDPFEALREDVV